MSEQSVLGEPDGQQKHDDKEKKQPLEYVSRATYRKRMSVEQVVSSVGSSLALFLICASFPITFFFVSIHSDSETPLKEASVKAPDDAPFAQKSELMQLRTAVPVGNSLMPATEMHGDFVLLELEPRIVHRPVSKPVTQPTTLPDQFSDLPTTRADDALTQQFNQASELAEILDRTEPMNLMMDSRDRPPPPRPEQQPRLAPDVASDTGLQRQAQTAQELDPTGSPEVFATLVETGAAAPFTPFAVMARRSEPSPDGTLVGVFSTGPSRWALLRLRDGRVVRIEAGQRLGSRQIVAIEASGVILDANGDWSLLGVGMETHVVR